MENFDKQITSEVTKSPKNKKKIVLISVIAAVVVIVVLMSVLIPVLVLRSPKPTEESYFEFKANEDDMSYSIVGYKRFLPESVIIPETYDGYPVVSFSINSSRVKSIVISKNIRTFSIGSIQYDTDRNYYYINTPAKVELDRKNPYFTEKDKILYTSDMKSLVLCLPQKTGDFVIPKEINAKDIYSEAFSFCNLNNLYFQKESGFNIMFNEYGASTGMYPFPRFTQNLNLFFEHYYEDFDMDKYMPPEEFTPEELQQNLTITLKRILCVNSIHLNAVIPS